MNYQIVGCPSYGRLKAVSDQIWDSFPNVSGRHVFIKPNLVTPPTRYDYQSVTHVALVELVIQRLRDAGARRITIGDCGFKGQWEATLKLSGYERLSDRYGVELIGLQEGENFHKFSLRRFQDKSEYVSLYGAKFSDYMLESDVVINLPKLKVHSMAFVTGAIKNMMGCMAQKGSMHPRACRRTLHKRLRDFYFLLKQVKPFWCLMDGIVGAEYSEQYGVPVKSGWVASSSDLWVMDCVAAQLMGISPKEVPYLRAIASTLRISYPELSPSQRKWIRAYERPLAWRP